MLDLKFDENHKPIIEGNINFEADKITIYDSDTKRPQKTIKFLWNPEMKQDAQAFIDDRYNEMYEAIGKKLKLDFIGLY